MKKMKRSIALLLCIMFGCTLIGCGSTAQGGASEAKAALDEYFGACGMLDFAAIHNASYPEGMEGPSSARLLSESDSEVYKYWISDMGFARSDLEKADWLRFSPDLAWHNDYKLVRPGETGEMLDAEGNGLTMEEVFADFSVSYDIEAVDSLENVTLSRRDGLKLTEIGNMDEIVALADGSNLDVDAMYVAQISVEWYYGDNLYGYNKDWWNDESFAEKSGQTYDAAIESRADYDYVVFVYQYAGEWYVYPENLTAGLMNYTVEF